MPSRTLHLDALKGVTLEEIITRVLRENRPLVISVSGGQAVVIEPKQELKPLPVLDGYVPEGWKDAVYAK